MQFINKNETKKTLPRMPLAVGGGDTQSTSPETPDLRRRQRLGCLQLRVPANTAAMIMTAAGAWWEWLRWHRKNCLVD